MNLVSSIVGMSFFHLCFRFWVEVFSYCTFTETFANGLQNWFDHKWIDFGVFFWTWLFSLTYYLHWLKFARIAQFLFPFWRHQVFSITSLKDTLVCCSNVLVLFSHKIIYYRLICFSIAMQLYFLSFCVFQSSPPDSVLSYLFDYFWSENQLVRFQSFVLNIFWDSTSYTVIIMFWMLLMERINALARWWPCACLKCVSGLQRLDKDWTFGDAYMSLTW